MKPDIRLQDMNGWTVVHHIVKPMEYGYFQNYDLLELLAPSKKLVNTKNKAGLTAYQMAVSLNS